MNDSGLYLVTLNNLAPISVNAHDRRLADKCIEVTRDHCKFGKARSFSARHANYCKTFGAHNVNFRHLASLVDIRRAESLVLKRLLPWRIPGRSVRRRTEWLAGIATAEVERIVFEVLEACEFEFVDLRTIRL